MKLPNLIVKWVVILLATALLAPTTFVYSIGALAWFMFVAAFLMTAVEAVNRLGWSQVLHNIAQSTPAESPGIDVGQFSLFVIGSGIGLAAAWATLGSQFQAPASERCPNWSGQGSRSGGLLRRQSSIVAGPYPKAKKASCCATQFSNFFLAAAPAIASALLVGRLAWSGGKK